MDRRKLPKAQYQEGTPIMRQVFDIEIKRVVTEYRAQVLIDPNGNRFRSFLKELINLPNMAPMLRRMSSTTLKVNLYLSIELLRIFLTMQTYLSVEALFTTVLKALMIFLKTLK